MNIYIYRYILKNVDLHEPLYISRGLPWLTIQPRAARAIMASMFVMRAITFLDVATQSVTSLRVAHAGTSSGSVHDMISVAACMAHSILAFVTRSGSTTGAATRPNWDPSVRAVMLASTGVNFDTMAAASFCMAAKLLADSLALCA